MTPDSFSRLAHVGPSFAYSGPQLLWLEVGRLLLKIPSRAESIVTYSDPQFQHPPAPGLIPVSFLPDFMQCLADSCQRLPLKRVSVLL